jgi:hypothetical protein
MSSYIFEHTCNDRVLKAKEVNNRKITIFPLGRFSIIFTRDPMYLEEVLQHHNALRYRIKQTPTPSN